ncbi:MAG: 1-deoxy-D-xylulose-5-phosphate reductoisomerase [Porticoccaceae bacterium]|nr:1-deoxy-D-xylulose-5-phosphate reductoisomerase [Porticoccaceae bacterium]
MQQITILGSTGSIGVSSLDVIARHPDQFRVFALTGHSRIEVLAEQCQRFVPAFAVVPNAEAASQLSALVPAQTRVLCGVEGLIEVASHSDTDTVVAAIVGAAGLLPTIAAAEAGKKILLANKEALVMAGALFLDAVKRGGATLLPLDSEHNAIFQCLPPGFTGVSGAGLSGSGLSGTGVSKLVLSASGGPFRTTPIEQLMTVSPDQACAHPNWSMGRKISVDSATMMNKGLELIEACWLFNVAAADVEIVIHPQSIVHSLVEYVDGSVLAQLGNPDMRTPIAHALAWPERIASGVARLNLTELAALEFEPPDAVRFPALTLARQAGESMGDAPTALNAANEVAVAAFLTEQIRFPRIAAVVAEVMAGWQGSELACLEAVQDSDSRARRLAQASVAGYQDEV